MIRLHDLKSLAAFAQKLVTAEAMPVLAAGYRELVENLRADSGLSEAARTHSVDSLLAQTGMQVPYMRKSNRELVTSFEKDAEARMVAAVKSRFPDHAIVGEELGVHAGGDIRWVFDPIDGTSAMIRTALAEAFNITLPLPLPAFGTTVAVVDGNDAVIGVVAALSPHNAELKITDLWCGVRNQATYHNGMPVSPAHTRKASMLPHARLATTAPEVMFGTAEKWSGWQALSETVNAYVRDQNCIGYMRLLEENSGIDIVYESDLAYHDAAALVPLLAGAGIKISDAEGNIPGFAAERITTEFTLLAAGPSLHAQALACIRKGVPAGRNRFTHADISNGYARKFPSSET